MQVTMNFEQVPSENSISRGVAIPLAKSRILISLRPRYVNFLTWKPGLLTHFISYFYSEVNLIAV